MAIYIFLVAAPWCGDDLLAAAESESLVSMKEIMTESNNHS